MLFLERRMKMKLLVIDPGHGGKEPGAMAFGYVEKDLNLIVGKRVAELLKEYSPVLTRDEDITLDLGPRAALVKDKYQYCLSIHLNASGFGARGIETIFSIFSSAGKKLADAIAQELKAALNLPVRRVFSLPWNNVDYYYMHRNTGKTVTVIVESLFLDSKADIQRLNIENISQGIANGFRAFMTTHHPTRAIFEYSKVADTDICYIDPMVLQFAKVNKSGKDLLKSYKNFANGMFFGENKAMPGILTVGTGYSQGKKITERLPWDTVKRGTFIIYKDSTVEVLQSIDPDKDRKDIWFCVQGIGLNPVNLAAEWQPLNIGRSTSRIMLGYNPEKNRIVITIRPESDIERGKSTLANLGCIKDGKVLGIGLDSGTPATMVQYGSVKKLGEYLDNIIYW
jgi:hypothetical protein